MKRNTIKTACTQTIIFLFVLLPFFPAILARLEGKTISLDTTFPTITSGTVKLSQLKNKISLVVFWATDCPACIKEVPQLIKLHNQFPRNSFEIFAVSMYYAPPIHIKRFTEEQALPYKVVLDPQAQLAKEFGNVKLTPQHFLVNRNGMILWEHTGTVDVEYLKQKIQNLIKEETNHVA